MSQNRKLEFSLCNLFTCKSLQQNVEEFLYPVFSDEIEESEMLFFLFFYSRDTRQLVS